MKVLIFKKTMYAHAKSELRGKESVPHKDYATDLKERAMNAARVKRGSLRRKKQ
ncbi:hypothetical protein UFOVP967_34 [uncultured Caudovirales phage]|jgi:hypothetical protein|uniref:Uncharacterized protein n=1 Tax=uncultured Caudovirales phage TaxID=2100421 RepID=A0A6J5QYK8_9CAUD|nr:hypothetical protein UFOVP521_82 [uncultured Caudovirales phage]CAB4167755.1 hypothetical protein UFOVP856_54 [uncultured Caudovirales phage]CAB4174228.1 hypothetical protein UFOVP967_34 [uncultured Caudovirales phage]CAB4180539.1 hypothetical protein UFOVP1036_47 [uncultured Caudovirales phage]CAB4186158.1 hypothetical protein UFOVP1132_20 [uncultured Caudovirales phage]